MSKEAAQPTGRSVDTPLPSWGAVVLLIVAGLGFHISFVPGFGAVSLLFLLALAMVALRWMVRGSVAFVAGLLLGLGMYAPQLHFFLETFGVGAFILWVALAFWMGVFLFIINRCRDFFGLTWAALVTPVVWLGVEYLRGELYPLKFAWLTPSCALVGDPFMEFLLRPGSYGYTLFVLALVSSLVMAWRRPVLAALAVLAWVSLFRAMDPLRIDRPKSIPRRLEVAGLQVESPDLLDLVEGMNRLVEQHPRVQLVVLPEYTLDGKVPERLRQWCRETYKYLLVGGKEKAGNGFYNTAFVVGPDGKTVFTQAKVVPTRFLDDGYPAKSQSVWDSPWGKLGICLSHDLAYTKVTDELVRQGAEAFVVPAYEATAWGEHEHQLHSRFAPMRALEYNIPTFRIASSGVSQVVDSMGSVVDSIPYRTEGAALTGTLDLQGPGLLPLDRLLAPLCVFLSLVVCLYLSGHAYNQRLEMDMQLRQPQYAK